MSLRSPRRLLIAGAAGFIGSNFVRLLRATRPEVEITVLDKLTYAGTGSCRGTSATKRS